MVRGLGRGREFIVVKERRTDGEGLGRGGAGREFIVVKEEND